MNKIVKFVNKRLVNIKAGFIRFPESVVITVALVILMIINVETEANDELYRNIILALWIGLLLLTNVKLISEKIDSNMSRIVLDGVALILIILLYLIIPREMTTEFMTFYMSLCASLVIVFLMIPYFFRRDYFSYYCLRTALNVFLTLFYGLVVFAGISGLVFAVESLFELDFSDMIYLDMLIVSLVLFGVVYFLSTIEAMNHNLDINNYPKGIRVVLTMILIPLMIAYTIIMYAYFIRILITMEWPSGIVGQLVIWYGLAAWFTVFLLEGVLSLNKWQKKWLKYHPYVFILPILLMIISVGIRIYHYGVTQLRYYVILGAIWFVACTLVTLFGKYKTMVFALLGALLLLLGSFGPQGSVAVSFKSQESRMIQMLEENNMLDNGKIKPKDNLDKGVQDELMSAISYIDALDKLEDLDILPESFNMYEDMVDVFGFDSYYPVKSNNYYNYRISDFKEMQVLDGSFVPFRLEDGKSYKLGDYFVTINENYIEVQGTDLKIDLSVIAKDLIKDHGNSYEIPQKDLTYTYNIDETMDLIIVYENVNIEIDNSDYIISYCEGFMIISSAK